MDQTPQLTNKPNTLFSPYETMSAVGYVFGSPEKHIWVVFSDEADNKQGLTLDLYRDLFLEHVLPSYDELAQLVMDTGRNREGDPWTLQELVDSYKTQLQDWVDKSTDAKVQLPIPELCCIAGQLHWLIANGHLQRSASCGPIYLP